MTELFFYKNITPIDKKKHKDFKIKVSTNNFEFVKDSFSVMLTAVEFYDAMREYPILFCKDASDKIVPTALLGLRENENLYVDKDMHWTGDYVPAYVRRYPFIFFEQDQKLTLCIDADYKGFQKEEGDSLFLDDGEQGEALKKAMSFLIEYQNQFKRTEQFVEKLTKLDLLRDYNAKVNMVDGREFSVTNFMIIDEEKFKNISDEDVIHFFRDGDLSLIHAHLASLKNLQSLVNRIPVE